MLLTLSPILYFWLCSLTMITYSTLYTCSLQPTFITSLLMSDNFSYWLSYVTFVISFTSMIIYITGSNKFYFFFMLVGLTSIGVFMTSNLFLLYILFEASLIPIVYIILVWGVYPDRGSSSMMMMMYTSFFSIPLMSVLFYFFNSYSLSVSVMYGEQAYSTFWSILIIMMAFSVKLPLYGVHFWLPMAHVEAPTSGSMILAGVLLKLGGCGLYRFSMLFSLYLSRTVMTSYCVLCTMLVSFIAFTQSDLKRLVAYSSVVHMSILLLAFISFCNMSMSSFLLIMVCHGFSSPMMFLLVGAVYKLYQTRLLVMLRGIMLSSPILLIFMTLSFMSNIPTPPFSSFLAEIMLFMSIYSISSVVMLGFILVYAFAAIVFNTYWYTTVSFGPSSTSTSFMNLHFSDFMSLTLLSFNLILMISLINMF